MREYIGFAMIEFPECQGGMSAHGGDFIYRLARRVALLIFAIVVVGYLINSGKGEPVVAVIPLLFAGVIWLAGGTYMRIGASR